MNILITGWNGYLISHLKNYLTDKTLFFWGIVRSKEFSISDNIIYCDLASSPHINLLKKTSINFDIVLHAAGKIDISLNKNRDSLIPSCDASLFTDTYQQNVIITSNVLEMMHAKNIKKLIFMSSQTVYGTPQETTVTEKTPFKPLEHYALSKVMCEQMIELCSTYMDIQAAILRISGLYGGNRNQGLIHNVLRASLSKNCLNIGINYHLPIDIIHIDEVCQVLLRLIHMNDLQKPVTVFNCTSGEETNLDIILEDIFSITGVRHSLAIKNSPVLVFKNSKLIKALGISFECRKNHLEKEWQKVSKIT